ncbi:MAG: FecR domain-containing protein, partial [Pyrinomonadaceae bacterium]
MYSRHKALLAAALLVPMILCVNAFGYVVSDDDVPEVTARVARVTFTSGDVQVRRLGNTDWERATSDLPMVEGDEIATGTDGRLEIQLNSFGYLRLEKNSYLRISTFKDEGVAVSISEGSMSVRFLDFDKDKSYFEIDAPKTTIAVEKAGIYRIDAGSDNDDHVRVTVTESGEARVYSENSGFTLKNGRSATITIDGDLAGEWETAAAAKFADDFDGWALDRDAVIDKKLNDAYYDKYYDRDIYG